MKRFPWILPVILTVTLIYATSGAVRDVALKRDIARLKSSNTTNSPNSHPQEDKRLESRLSELAKLAKVKELLGVSTRGNGNNKTISIEWEATPRSTIMFLAALGPCLDLVVTPSPVSQAHVRARGIFAALDDSITPSKQALRKEAPKFERNVFAALWKDTAAASAEREERERKRAEEARVAEEKKTEKEKIVREESQKLSAARRNIETQLFLTGIVNNGREAIAFVSSQNAGGRTQMLRVGDVIEDARLTRIDEKRNEVKLDYQGKFEVVIKLNTHAGGIQ